MSDVQVRPFRRGDRDQLTQLVNAHAEAVVPGMSVSVNTVLSSLERQPGEFIEDPWVSDRVTLVAEQRSRVAAAAHLLRYFPDERAGQAARDVGEIRWLLYWPLAPAGNPCWPDATGAAEALMAACVGAVPRWGVAASTRAENCPCPASTGSREQWPHVAALYRRAGFTHTGHTEIVYLAQVQDLPSPAGPPLPGLTAAALGRDQRLPPVRRARPGGDRLYRDRDPGRRRAAVPARRVGRRRQPACRAALPAPGRRILAARAGRRLAPAGPGQPAAQLRLAGRHRPGGQDYDDYRAFLPAVGFRELTRTARGWTRE